MRQLYAVVLPALDHGACDSMFYCYSSFSSVSKLCIAVTLDFWVIQYSTVPRGKVMSHGANKLQMPFLSNSIYISDPFLRRSINSCEKLLNSCRHYILCTNPFVEIIIAQSEEKITLACGKI